MIKKRRVNRTLHWAVLFPVVGAVLVLAVSGCAPQAEVANVEDDAAGEAVAPLLACSSSRLLSQVSAPALVIEAAPEH